MQNLLARRVGVGLLSSLLTGATWTARDQSATPAWRAEKIWQDASTDATGDVSADGRLLTFIDLSSGLSELSIRDLSRRTNRVLVPRGRTIYGSVISPDGTLVAFSAWNGKSSELNIVPVKGGDFRTIDTGRGIYPSWVHDWTPDGRELLVINTVELADSGEVGLINIQTGRFRSFGAVEPGATAKISPDGSRVVVSELAKPQHIQRDIRVVDVASGRSQPMLAGPQDDYSAAWARDGQTIYFLSDRDKKARLWKLPLLKTGDLRPEPLHEIPDGADRIIGVIADGRILVGAEDVGGTTTVVADVDWRTGMVTHSREVAHPPLRGSRRSSLSPDGEQVAFLRRPRGGVVRPGWQIPVVQSYDGRHERTYETALTIRDEPYWFPDGSGLLLVTPPEGAVGESVGRTWRFIRLDLRQGSYTELRPTGTSGTVRIAGLVADEVFYLLNDLKSAAVVALDLKTGARREMYRRDGQIRDTSVSSDGTRIVFPATQSDGTIGLFVASAATEPRRIASLQQGGSQLMWFSDGESVLTSGRIDGQLGIWRVSVNGHPPVRLNLDSDDITEVRASMDGRRVTFTRRFQRQREVWEYWSR